MNDNNPNEKNENMRNSSIPNSGNKLLKNLHAKGKGPETGFSAGAGASAASSSAAGTTGASTVTATATATGAVGSTGAGVAFIILLPIIIGIFFTLSVTIISEYLTPENVSKAAVEYEKNKFTFESISDFFSSLFHLEKDIDKIEVSDDEYDKNNEYDVGLVENLNAINTALNYSYNKYMSDYIKSYCSTNDYDFSSVSDIIQKKYPNGWKDIYSNINYGELIVYLSLGYKTRAYGEGLELGDPKVIFKTISSKDNVSYFFGLNVSTEIIDTNTKADSESQETINSETTTDINKSQLLQNISDPTAQKNLTDTDTSNETETVNTKKVVIKDVEILPFCQKNIFNLLKIDMNSEYDSNITFYDMSDSKLLQVNAICEDTTGSYRTIYYTLGLDNPKAQYDYSFSPSKDSDLFNQVTVESVAGENSKIVWHYLKTQGHFTDEGASGIMGNLMAEHGFQTSMQGEGGSVGIAQWTGNRKESLILFAQRNNAEVTDINIQAAFLTQELQSSKYDCIRNANDIIDAADYAAFYYEACSRYPSYEAYLAGKYAGKIDWHRYFFSDRMNTYILDLDKRRNYSTTFYNLYKGTE